MYKVLFKYLVVASALTITSVASADRVLYVSEAGNGVYQVTDERGYTVYVKDVKAYIKNKYQKPKVDGFGKRITHKTFAQGNDPVAETAAAIAAPVNSAANTAYNAANMVPSWRKYTGPLRTVLGLPKKSTNQRQ